MKKDDGFAEGAFAIDVSGGDDELPQGCRAIYVGGAGDLAVTMWDGGNVTFAGVTAGSWYPIRVSAVLQTGTTATGLIALL